MNNNLQQSTLSQQVVTEVIKRGNGAISSLSNFLEAAATIIEKNMDAQQERLDAALKTNKELQEKVKELDNLLEEKLEKIETLEDELSIYTEKATEEKPKKK